MEKLNSISLQSDFIRALDNDMTFKIDRDKRHRSTFQPPR